MKKLITSIFLGITLTSQFLFAHGDGHAEINESQVAQAANIHIEQLVGEKKLPESWKGITTPNSSQKKTNKGVTRWVVVFENAKETDAAKKKLELLIKPSGNLDKYQFIK